ncbi:Acetoacetyl-CoA synthetase [Rhodococcus sp. B7740]|uniref:class I adenylate-forming enzyme family protein n=1 Tax=Rhodococcus sp. B7740 TaxID=1564114 RepID=UPI0005D7D6C4|nr:class I adenylate-forming enzyme family protein [Rhodococcus sp. B7740]AJW40303.1 Acetoacetyl-CoA synthetase [Rhodococcus sp. B7740]
MSTITERRAQLLDRYPTWTPRTLDAWLDEVAQVYPDRPFVITDERTSTYADVEARSRLLADGLTSLGVRPGDHVGMLMANYADFVPLKFAIARAGAVAIPFNYLYQRDELEYVLKQSHCSFLITMSSFSGLDYLAMLDDIAPGWAGSSKIGTPRAQGGELPALRHVAVYPTADDGRDDALTLDDIAELGRVHPGASNASTHGPMDIADLLYTSGSTGSPKGVLVTHDSVLRTGYASALSRAYEDGRRILFSLPCYHMFGYLEGLISTMYVGGAVIMHTSFHAERYLEAIEKHRATDVLCVPTMAVALIESPARHTYDFSSLGAMFCASAPAPVWLWKQLQNDFGITEVSTGYGMTETGGCMTITFPEDDLQLSIETVGRPKIAGAASRPGTDALCEYRAVDPDTGTALPAGVPGELASAGPTAMLGYFDKPAETSAALRDGWVFSGDLGLVSDDGYLRLTGRSKEVYKSGGELVMPKEVEDVIVQHDEITQAFAFGVQDDRWGEVGWVVVVTTPGSTIDSDGVIEHCKANLARFKVPRRVVFMDTDNLPKTATGKVQKFRLYDAVQGAL